MNFFFKNFFSKRDQICSFLRIWSHLLNKSSMENFIFCAVKELNGVILSQYHFGTHLHNNNKAINEELEPQNFEYAGELIAELWSKLPIDGDPVVAEFVEENHRISPILSRKNGNLIMSVSLNTCCKLSNLLTKLFITILIFKVDEPRYKRCGVTPHFLKTKK